MSAALDVETATGLTSTQVEDRIARGLANQTPDARSRSLASIIRANTLTWFNGLIGGMWIVMIIVAPIQDSLFGFVIVANTLIGVIQEWRASRTLARLQVIGEARPLVRRDGTEAEIRPAEVVQDDIILLRTGDQLVVDGVICASDGLEIDESLLTGEADPVDKSADDPAMSGSFVVAGSGVMRATRVGRASFAAGLTEQARSFQQTNSELRDSVSRFIRIVSYLLVPVGALLLWSQLRADQDLNDALRGTIAGVVTMVPEGLVLLTSIAMAVAVVRLAAYKVLVQDMPAVEVLARVDTVCADKTGTLTEPGMRVREVIILREGESVADALAGLGASEEAANPTLQAVASAYPTSPWRQTGGVPFSSARKWSSAQFEGQGSWVMGAPEVLLPVGHDVLAQAETIAADGARVLLLGRALGTPDADAGVGAADPVALVVIDQMLRPDAADTVAYFLEQGVEVKVISGDNAATVGAIAGQAGVPGADAPVDARSLGETPEALEQPLRESAVFGRVTPAQKQAMVGALHRRERTVAMTGDGVNDVLALKQADLGIAMGSGSGATRAVAQLVLLDNRFAVMPHVVAEGRRVLGNIERVADVFLTKTFYAITISLLTGLTALAFPFLPRHLTLISALTIGIPGFFLALMPNTERFRPGFFRRVLIQTIPCGLVAAAAAMTSYYLALRVDQPEEQARTAATITLFCVATAVLTAAARPLNLLRIGIVVAMIIAFVAVFLIPFTSTFFQLAADLDAGTWQAIGIGIAGALLVGLITTVTDRWRRA